MKFAYYYAVGKYGDYIDRIAYTNFLRVSANDWRGDSRGEIPAMLDTLARAVSQGFDDICLGLDIDVEGAPKWKDVIRELVKNPDIAQYVHHLELRDEPEWNEEEAKDRAHKVRFFVEARGMSVRLGVGLSTPQTLDGRGRIYTKENGYDWVSAAAFLDIDRVWTSEEAESAVRRLIKQLRKNVSRTVGFWVIGQAYDRNGAFGTLKALREMQLPTYEAAKTAGAKVLLWFAYGRPGGVLSHNSLRAKHKAIAARE